MSTAHNTSAGTVWCAVALGLVAGLVISGLAAFFTGAGHGWGSAVISSSSIIGAPLAAVAWTLRGSTLAKACAPLALLIGLATDAWLWIATIAEGVSYVARIWEVMPLPLLLWLALFLGWQLVAARAMQSPSSTNSP